VTHPQQTFAKFIAIHLFTLAGPECSREAKSGFDTEPSMPVSVLGPERSMSHVLGQVMKMEMGMNKILTAALLASVATSAFAADLPTHKGPPPAPAYYAPPFTWTGFYVGVNGGGAFTDVRGNQFIGGGSAFGSPSGGMVGGQIGYNYQINQLVLGVEGSLDWTDLSQNRTFGDGSTDRLKVDSFATALARVGYAYDRTLFYVAGGYAGGDVHAGAFNDATLGATFPGNSSWQSGYAVGGGVEYAITNNISVKGEYLFSQLGSKTYYGGTPDVVKAGLDINILRAGVNYKF
jgi:outer membrane immunogenic protein